MIRASVTDVEAVRSYLAGDGWCGLDELIAQLRRQTEPTEAMRVGTAFHQALEHVREGTHSELVADAYCFEIPGDVELTLPEHREERLRGRIGGLDLTGRVDGRTGSTVVDYKTTRSFNPERLLTGYPWRLYLALTGAWVFTWHVFELKRTGPPPGVAEDMFGDPDLRPLTTYQVRAHHRLTQYAYPELLADCHRVGRRFADFARAYLPERCRVA